MEWQPIETCPQTGFFLVEEDAAIRTMWRYEGRWESPAMFGLVGPWGDFINGPDDLRRVLPEGYRIAIRELCMEPNHWMPLPKPPEIERATAQKG